MGNAFLERLMERAQPFEKALLEDAGRRRGGPGLRGDHDPFVAAEAAGEFFVGEQDGIVSFEEGLEGEVHAQPR